MVRFSPLGISDQKPYRKVGLLAFKALQPYPGAVILANFLSNRNGLNTISTLMVIALAIVSHDQETITQIKARVLAAGKFLGTIAGDWVRAQARYDKRYQLLILMAGGAAPANLAVAMAAKFQEVYPDR